MVETGGLENVSSSVVLPVFSRLAPRISGSDWDVRAHSASSMQPSVQLIQDFLWKPSYDRPWDNIYLVLRDVIR